MPINAVNSPTGGLGLAQSRTLAETLTDAVLVPEVGQFAPPARVGFQVHFVERRPDVMAIGGRLLADVGPEADVMVIDVAVMDGDWRQEVRAAVIERTLAAMADGRWPMADACGLDRPSPTWWGNFRVSDEGSRGPSGGVLSVLPLLGTGVFTESKARPSAPHWVRAPAPPGPGVRTPAGPRPGRFAVAPAMRA